MGTTYSNCQVRSDSQESVVAALTGLLKEPAYVALAVNGWVGVYPEGDADAADKLAKKLSAKLACGVFFRSVYDSDIFLYTLYEDGKKRDEFDSNPDYFETVSAAKKARLRGKPEALVPYCLPGIGYSQVREVLHPAELAEPNAALATLPPGFSDGNLQVMANALNTSLDALKQDIAQKRREKYTDAEDQATALATLLGISASLANSGYQDIDGDDVENPDKEEFRLVGNNDLSQQYKDSKLWSLECLQNPENLSRWLQQGANPNVRNQSGLPILLHYIPFPENLAVLLSAGAEVNITSTRSPYLGPEHPEVPGQYEAGVTALMVAARLTDLQTGRVEKAVRALLTAGADVNAYSEIGRTALNEALKMTDPAQHKKQIGRRLSEGLLQQAAECSGQIAELLRAAGAME